MNIALYPWNSKLLSNEIFVSKKDKYGFEHNFFCTLKEEFHLNNKNIQTIDIFKDFKEIKCIVFFDMPEKKNIYFKKFKKAKADLISILFLWEPPVVSPKNYKLSNHYIFDYVITWNENLIDNKKYFKFNYPQMNINKPIHELNFSEKKFCTMVCSNKQSKIKNELYSKRLEVINYFEFTSDQFDFYGVGWLDKPIFLGYSKFHRYLKTIIWYANCKSIRNFKNYKGTITNKLEAISNYKFTISFENQKNLRGYVTEKIFDCLISGTVPIYLGSENISEIIPFKCFIDYRDFNSIQELVDYLRNIDERDYEDYLLQAKEFLKSDFFKIFTYSEQIRELNNYIDRFEDEFRRTK